MTILRNAVVFTLVLAGIALAQPKPPDAPQEDETLKAHLDRKLPEIRCDKLALTDVIDFLRDVTGAGFFVDWNAIEKLGLGKETPVTLRLRDVPLRTTLDKLVEAASTPKAKLGWATDGRLIVITSADAAKVRPKHITGQLPDDVDRTLPEIRVDAVAFEDVLSFLSDVTRTRIVPNWADLKAAGIEKSTPITFRVRETKLSTTLRLALEGFGDGKTPLQFNYADKQITITATPKPQ